VFAVLQAPVTGTDDALIRRNLQTAYLQFLTMIINAGLQGIFLTDRE
jgi:exportin-T